MSETIFVLCPTIDTRSLVDPIKRMHEPDKTSETREGRPVAKYSDICAALSVIFDQILLACSKCRSHRPVPLILLFEALRERKRRG